MRNFHFYLLTLGTLLASFGIYAASLQYFQSEELEQAKGRLSVYENTVAAELERFSHLTYILARDPFVQATLAGEDPDALNARLGQFVAEAELDAIYLMDPSGLTISASNADQSSSFVGQNYGFRPYFQDALRGQQGRFYAIGATTGLPGYFIADAVASDGGSPAGVVAIKLDLSKLEDSWRNSGEQVLLVNQDGVVLLASDPAWRYRTLSRLTDAQRAAILEARQFFGQELDLLNWRVSGDQRAELAGDDRLHIVSTKLPHGWQLHYFASDDRAVTRSWLVTIAAVFLAAVGLIIFQIYRVRRVNAALAISEREEAELRLANERLADEISDRRRAERRLQRTQLELERASRLAALGQLAASVTHELGQPITAMRNHLVAAELGNSSRENLSGIITGLVDRMEGITRQLKFFASSETEAFSIVDLRQAVEASLTLLCGNIETSNVRVTSELPESTLHIRGIQLRIEQVITNLLRNAIDATDGQDDPQIVLRAGAGTDGVWLEIEDNGHGLGQAALSDLQEPFITTRESGKGMGLGLAISAAIVKDHGGTMTARNNETGGATFRVGFNSASTEDE